MPTVNTKLLLRLILVTLVLGVGMFILNYVQTDRITDALRWQSEHAAENGRLDKAIFYMKQYLELRPTDHDAAVKLAELIQSKGQGRKELANVLFLYERVVREAPERTDLRRKLVDICLRLDRYGDAMIHARAILDQSPNDGMLWEKLGVAQVSQNKHDDARASFSKAIECEPSRIRSYELLAEVQIRHLQLANDGRETIDRMVKTNPASAEAYLVRARYNRSQNKSAECMRDLETLMLCDPENADGLLMFAELAQLKQDLARARDLLSDGMALHMKDVRFYRALSWLELSSGNLPAGVACLEQGIRQLPNAAELLAPLGDLLVQQGDAERVREIAKKLEGRRGYESQSRYLTARLQMLDGKWVEAAASLESLRNQAVNSAGLAAQINLLLATCHEKLGKRDDEIESLKRVLTSDTGNLSARLKFGMLYLTNGELDKAIDEYVISARSPFAPLSARIMLGRLMIARARAAGTSADWSKISEYVKLLRDKYKNSVEPVLTEAEMLMARNQYDTAKKLLRDEAGRKLNDPRIWSVLAAIALETEGMHAAIDVVDEAQRLTGDQVELRLARARIWATDWQRDRGDRLRSLGQTISAFSEADQFILAMGMTEICASIRDFEGLKHFQKQVAARVPGDLLIRRGLYESALRSGDEPLQQAMLTEIDRLGGRSMLDVADSLHACTRPLPAERLQQLRSQAAELLTKEPKRADAHLLMARVADQTGDAATAGREYAQAIALESGNLTNLELHLSFLLRQGDAAAGRKRIELLFADPRMSGEAFLGLIEGATFGLTPEQQTRCMAEVQPLVRKSGVSLLWLARVEQSRGRMSEARVLAEQVTKAFPQLADGWIARVRLQPEKALDLIKTARATLSAKDGLIVCAETADIIRSQQPEWVPELKQPAEVRLFAQAMLNTRLARGKVSDAAVQLNQVIDSAGSTPDEAAWAKQNLAIITASRGGAGESQKAAALLKDVSAKAEGTLDDQRGRAASFALASQNLTGVSRKGLLQKSIEIMRQVSIHADATARDWFQLAQLYRQAGDRTGGETAFKEAMRRDEGNLHYVLARIEELLNDSRVDEAEVHLGRLAEASHDPRAAGTLCRYYALAGLPQRSIEAVDRYVRSAESGTADGPTRMRLAADMLDRATRAAMSRSLPGAKALSTASVDRYRQCLKSYPDAVVPLALLLAADGKAAQAFEVLETARPNLSPMKFLTQAVAVLQVGTSGPRQFQQVKGWLDAAMSAEPESSTVRLCMAEYHALRQDYTAAEPLYREILRSEPDNIVALNNLAWILSPRGESLDEALRSIERAINVMGPNPELLDTRARVQIARGSYDRAIEDLTQALESGQTALRYFHLAVAQFKQLKKTEAVQSFREAKNRGLDVKAVHPSDQATYRVLAAQVGD